MSITVMDCDEREQAAEIRSYLKEVGAEGIQESDDPNEIDDILQGMSVCWISGTEADVESVSNSIISLLLHMRESKVRIESLFCNCLVEGAIQANRALLGLKILTSLFHGIHKQSPDRYSVYMSMLKLAKHARTLHMLTTELNTLQEWRLFWKLSMNQWHSLLRLLHEILLLGNDNELANKIMFEILGSYTEQNAAEAKDEATRCIISCLKHPNIYLFDHLLSLKPVTALQGEKLYDLLTIFVTGTLKEYQAFVAANPTTLEELGLEDTECLRKMRLLAFMSLANQHKVLDCSSIAQEVQIPLDRVEPFVIDGAVNVVIALAKHGCHSKHSILKPQSWAKATHSRKRAQLFPPPFYEPRRACWAEMSATFDKRRVKN